jgi:spermidine synthase
MSRAYKYTGSDKGKVAKILVLCIVAIILLITTVFVTKNKDGINILTEKDSDFGSVWVFEENGQRCMTFIKPPTPIVQSCSFTQNPKIILHPYAQLFLSTLFLNDSPQRILVIGLGGANIQNALNILLPRTQIDTVEINPVLPRLVEKYFGYKEDARNKIFIEDAADFAKNTEANTYDIILIDAFDADYIPPQLLTDQFMQDVKKMLTPVGVVAINTFTISKTYEHESNLFKRNLGNYYNLIINKSRVMIAGKNNLPDLKEIAEKAVLWRFRFVEVGVDQNALLGLYRAQN